MRHFFSKSASPQDVLDALSRSLAIIEFDPKGLILGANANFCTELGYEAREIVGRHHCLFVEDAFAKSPAYTAFWTKLGQAEFDSGVYKRLAKGGREIWIQATYNPVRTKSGAVTKIVKFASNITAATRAAAENEGKLNAISRAQAMIEFNTDGTIITANENFLQTIGYDLCEIEGRHHRMFVEPTYARSADYARFWKALNQGEYFAAEFKRVGKGGREVWIQASYNPIFDASGTIVKIVKFASDITDRIKAVAETKATLASLQKVSRQVDESAQAIGRRTEEIKHSADDLSRRTEQQAASLEQTSAAMDEITNAVQKTAEGASHAKNLVGVSRAEAEKSGQIVGQAVDAMNAIEKSSLQISQIIGVIDEIAFQTNLLALNAGVEAARAGEAGRGFAVVASEVRALAQRSAEAAKEIKALITASTAQVERGVDLVAEAGKALGRIASRVNEINGFVGDIADAAMGQSTSLKEVNAAVKQMDIMTQQNVAMVEEATAATHELAREAEVLTQMIAGDDTDTKPVPAVRPRQAPPRAAISLKAAGRGGAARKIDVVTDDWEEF